jgi:hypothetical protein
MTPQTLQKTLLLARTAGELIKRAQEAAGQSQQKQAAINARIPATVDALTAGGRIYAEDKEAVSRGLQDHGTCLELLEKLAYHRNDSEVATLGHPMVDTAPAKKIRYCGAQVSDWDDTEGGQAFRRIMMGG